MASNTTYVFNYAGLRKPGSDSNFAPSKTSDFLIWLVEQESCLRSNSSHVKLTSIRYYWPYLFCAYSSSHGLKQVGVNSLFKQFVTCNETNLRQTLYTLDHKTCLDTIIFNCRCKYDTVLALFISWSHLSNASSEETCLWRIREIHHENMSV